MVLQQPLWSPWLEQASGLGAREGFDAAERVEAGAARSWTERTGSSLGLSRELYSATTR